jgi:hypothetical protein
VSLFAYFFTSSNASKRPVQLCSYAFCFHCALCKKYLGRGGGGVEGGTNNSRTPMSRVTWLAEPVTANIAITYKCICLQCCRNACQRQVDLRLCNLRWNIEATEVVKRWSIANRKDTEIRRIPLLQGTIPEFSVSVFTSVSLLGPDILLTLKRSVYTHNERSSFSPTQIANSMELSATRKAAICAATLQLSSILWNRRSLDLSTSLYPEPDQSSPYHSIICLPTHKRIFNACSTHATTPTLQIEQRGP